MYTHDVKRWKKSMMSVQKRPSGELVYKSGVLSFGAAVAICEGRNLTAMISFFIRWEEIRKPAKH